jgi:Holliday junction resolvase RusA-like endonuclease
MNNKWQVVKEHGFSINKMYDNRTRTPQYNAWYNHMLEVMKTLPSLEEMNVDPEKPMKIDIVFYTIIGVDIDNLIKSFLDVLVDYYELEDDNNFVEINIKRGDKFVESKEDGAIFFNIENCEGLILDIFDRLLLDIRYKL